MRRATKKKLKKHGSALTLIICILLLPVAAALTVKYMVYPVVDFCVWSWNLII